MKTPRIVGPIVSAASPEAPAALSARVETPRLVLESARRCVEQKDFYRDLWSDARVDMKDGKNPVVRKNMAESLGVDAAMWQVGVPFSAVVVRRKNDGKLIGNIGVRAPDESGQIEIGVGFKPEFWRQGYGSEGVRAYVTNILPFLAIDPNPWGNHILVKKVSARARIDSYASLQILKGCGFVPIGQETEEDGNLVMLDLPIEALKISLRQESGASKIM